MPENNKNIIKGRQWMILLFILILLLITATVYIAWINHQNYKDKLTEQWKQQLLTTTKISATNIESYFNKFSENLLSVSKNPLIGEKVLKARLIRKDTAYCCIENLYEIHQKDINSILLLDKNGLIIKKYPWWKDSNLILTHCKRGVNPNLYNRPQDIEISKVFLNQMQNPAFTITCPIFNEDSFTGVVRWMIEINKVSRQYIDSVKIGNNGYMWLMDEKNTIRAHHDPTFLGLKLDFILRDFDVTKKIPGYSSKKSGRLLDKTKSFFDEVREQNEGYGDYIEFAHNEYSLAVFKKVQLGNKSWTLIMSVPYSEITGPVFKNAIKTFTLAAIVTVILTILFASFYSIHRSRVQFEKEASYLEKIARSAEELKEERQKRLTAQIDGQEMERKRVSRELHDGLGQQLLAVKVKLEELSSAGAPQFKNIMNDLRQRFLKTIDETKRISNNLMPVTLEELGIETALKNLSDEFVFSDKLKVDYVSHGVPEHVSIKQKTYLYRIAQEALNNVVKHASASEVNMQLLGNNEQLTLIIQDDGKGFEYGPGFVTKGNGLNNIKDRVEILGGILNINSDKNQGTMITVKIPLRSRS